MFTLWFGAQLFLLGIGVGIFSAALGLGGGVIMVPAFLAFVSGMDPHTAKGTSLFIIIFVSGLNAWRQNKDISARRWRQVALLAGGSIIGGYGSAYVTALLPGDVILVLFIVLLVVLAVRTFFMKTVATRREDIRWRPWVSFGIGVIAGITGGSTGTGGGAVLIPLALMAGLVLNERVVGLSNLVMVFTSIAGTIAHLQAERIYDAPWTIGHVSLSLAPLVFIGAQVGSEAGYRINEHLSLNRRRALMGVMLVAISAQLLYRLLTT